MSMLLPICTGLRSFLFENVICFDGLLVGLEKLTPWPLLWFEKPLIWLYFCSGLGTRLSLRRLNSLEPRSGDICSDGVGDLFLSYGCWLDPLMLPGPLGNLTGVVRCSWLIKRSSTEQV